MRTITTCVFDAYGTLFDVSAAARAAANEPAFSAIGANWPKLAEIWRLKQLQYSWLRAISDAHTDFWTVTCEALDFALEATGHDDDPALRTRLQELYRELSAYPEVPDMLTSLRGAGYATAILSNGSAGMLVDAVTSAGITDQLDAVLSVDDVGVFKPAKAVYDLVGKQFGCAPEQVLFVSSNGWDAAGASGYGFQTVWVNRAGDPVDRLPWRPHHILSDLSPLPELCASLT